MEKAFVNPDLANINGEKEVEEKEKGRKRDRARHWKRNRENER